MAVEISGVPGTPANNKTVEQTGASAVNSAVSKTSSPSSAVNTGAPTTDSFTISQQAERLRVIDSTINTQPDVDGARIESLKIAIDAGRYDIDPLRVAEKLIEFEMQIVA